MSESTNDKIIFYQNGIITNNTIRLFITRMLEDCITIAKLPHDSK